MVDRYLGDIKAIADAALDAKQAREQAEKETRLSARQAEKLRKQNFHRRVREEIAYLQDNGTITAFQAAAKTLKPAWPDARLTIEKPEYDKFGSGPVAIALKWNYRLEPYNGEWFKKTWVYNQILCSPKREKDGSITGLQLNDEKTISPAPEIFGPRLVEAIKHPTRNQEWPNWGGLVRRITVPVRALTH